MQNTGSLTVAFLDLQGRFQPRDRMLTVADCAYRVLDIEEHDLFGRTRFCVTLACQWHAQSGLQARDRHGRHML